MPKIESVSASGLFKTGSRKRRPAGVSRRDKYRRLQIEPLEARQVMSATPVSYDYDQTDVIMHQLLMDSTAVKHLTAASDLTKYTEAELASATQWVVFTELGTDLSPFAATGGFTVTGATDIVPGSYIITVGGGNHDAMISALSGHEVIDFFYPLVEFQLEETAITNDPFLERQWHLVNYGQEVGNPNFGFLFGTVDEDINIEGAWDFFTGEGVVIGIVDSGVELDHPDLIDNIRGDLGIDLAEGGTLPLPSGNDAHGTAVAGLAAGVGNNGVGITGVAYNADIAPIRLFSDDPFNPVGASDFTIAQAFMHQFQQIDVYNHSWGIPPVVDDEGVAENPRAIHDLGPLSMLALRNSVFFGRGGLGSIHVFASGNSSGIRDSGNFSGLVNSRYTIAVGGVIHDGTAASYAEGGAAILVVAPTGSNPETVIRDDELGSGLTTTDLTGEAGYNQASTEEGLEVDADYLQDTDYSSRFNGTSAAAPLVTGVIALMLEANPSLTYRDVQHILVRSARQNSPNDLSWVTNVNEFFADPLAYDSDPEDSVFDGAWPLPSFGDPEAEVPTPDKLVRYQELRMPSQYTNGAGYTVSQMTTNTEYSYGHGVIDATMAVELARNWVTLGGQQSEYTWTTGPTSAPTIKPAEISSDETGGWRIPGGLNPRGDGPLDEPNNYIDFFDEFGEEDDPAVPGVPEEGEDPEDPDGPFSGDDPPVNTRDAGAVSYGQAGIPISVPSMTVEWIDLEITITGDENAFDFLRMSLVSPDGTVSELKPYDLPTVNDPVLHNILFDPITDPAGVLSPGSGGMTGVFTTNRHWGERTEGKPRLNTDGTPVRAFNPETGLYDGAPIVDGWRLVFENFSGEALDINTFELAFHGINTQGTGRIQGAVGVDDNIDGVFSDSTGAANNFTRYVEFERETVHPVTGEELDFRYVEDGSYQFERFLNPDQESWAAGAIVYVDLDQNGERDFTDPHYQVGADGNYYFDLPAGFSYDVRIDANSLEAAGLYNQQNVDIVADVLATATISAAGERVLATPVQGEEGATTFSAGYIFNFGTTTSVPELNILLVPNAVPEDVVTIGGTVYADLNENGVQDADDVGIGDAVVFIDINQNGVYSPGVDIITHTDAEGNYQFTDPFTGDELLQVTPGFYTVRVLEGTTGAFSEAVNPATAIAGFFFAPELVRNDVDFGFTYGEPGTGSPTAPAAISGIVFEDGNETGTRQAFERGLAGNVATVYIDENGNNQFDTGERTATLTPNGSFVFNSLPAGTYTVRIDFDDIQYRQTTPKGSLLFDGTRADEDDWEFEVTVTPGQAVTGLMFGLKNNAISDWGDLPARYGATTAAQNGAQHIYDGHMFLGSTIDTELAGAPSENADADDTTGINDEDGVVFSTLIDTSTTMTITVTASTNGGWLQGWMDWNEDGVFSGPSERVFQDVLLAEGENVFTINVPNSVLTTGTVYARFRYGEEGINSIHGLALKGEVEDYAIPVVSTAIDPGARIVHGPDFNEDGYVDGRDFLAWQRGFGITTGATPAQGDADSDGDVDRQDLAIWREEYGTSPGAVAALTTGGYTIDSPVFAAELARRRERRPLVPLVSSLVASDAVPSYTAVMTSVEASAQASTFGDRGAAQLAFGAGLNFGLRISDSPGAQRTLPVEDFDTAFDHFDRLSSFADRELDSSDRQTSARYLRGDDDHSEDEDDALALAFADAGDWRQF